MVDREGAASLAAAAAGFSDVQVRACGHDDLVAAVRLPKALRERALGEGLPELAAAIRGTGFRYVAMEMEAEE